MSLKTVTVFCQNQCLGLLVISGIPMNIIETQADIVLSVANEHGQQLTYHKNCLDAEVKGVERRT